MRGILAGAVQGNTDGVKTWYHFDIRPEMWMMPLNQDSRIFQHKKEPSIGLFFNLIFQVNKKHNKLSDLFFIETNTSLYFNNDVIKNLLL